MKRIALSALLVLSSWFGFATTNTQITLSWHSASLDWDVSFEVAYEEGDVIYQNEGGMSLPFSFTVNCMGSGYDEVSESLSEREALIFPNPSKDRFTVHCEGMKRIEVFSVDGRLVRVIKTNEPQCLIEGLDNGVYCIRLILEEGVITRRIVTYGR